MIQYLEQTQQALLVAARDLRALADAGLCKCPADVLIDDAIAVLRANCEVGQLRLEIAWQDRFQSPTVRWHLCAPEHTLDATTLSALLRVFGIQQIGPETPNTLNRTLGIGDKETSHGNE
jgi:hypothetical protein